MAYYLIEQLYVLFDNKKIKWMNERKICDLVPNSLWMMGWGGGGGGEKGKTRSGEQSSKKHRQHNRMHRSISSFIISSYCVPNYIRLLAYYSLNNNNNTE